MNWKTYKSLNEEQRLEYNYKYYNKPKFEIRQTLNAVSFFMLLTTMLIAMLTIVVDTKRYPDIEANMVMYVGLIGDMINILAPAAIIYLLYAFGSVTWNHISERRWININGIKNQGKWWQ